MNNNRNNCLYAIAVAIAFVGALSVDVPLGTVVWLLLVVACPLAMLFMMRGMRSPGTHQNGPEEKEEDPLHRHGNRHAGNRS
ncbi:DUF2933 domain-containing protein [Streptomyces thermolilacinus]